MSTEERRSIGTLAAHIRDIVVLPDVAEPVDASLWATLLSRRTAYGTTPLDVASVAALMHIACRSRPKSGFRRAWPSAGGVYPVEVLVEGIEGFPGLFRYCPDNHELQELDVEPALSNALRSLAETCLPTTPATLLWLIACDERLAGRDEVAKSLVWRDAGALLSTIHLTAHALGLLAAPLEVTGEPQLSQITWSMPVCGVGAMNLALAESTW